MPVGTFTSRQVYTAPTWEDVLPAFKTFLESDTKLVNAGEAWTVEYFHDDRTDTQYDHQQLVVKMPGYGSPFQDGTFVIASMAVLDTDYQQIKLGYLPSGYPGIPRRLGEYSIFPTSGDRFINVPMTKANIECHFYANAVSAALILISSGNTHGTIFGWADTFFPTSDWARPMVLYGHKTSYSYAGSSYDENWTSSNSYITDALIISPSGTSISAYGIRTQRESYSSPYWTAQKDDGATEVVLSAPYYIWQSGYSIPVGIVPNTYITSTQGVGQGDTFSVGGDAFYVYDSNGNGVDAMHALRYKP